MTKTDFLRIGKTVKGPDTFTDTFTGHFCFTVIKFFLALKVCLAEL